MPSKNNSALAQTAAGVRAFEQYCVKCHGDPSSAVAAPDELKLRRLTGDEIYAVLGKGTHANLEGLTENDRLEVALNLGGRKPGVAQITDAKLMKNQCQSKLPLGDISTKSSWTGWGNDPTSNARFQTAKAAGLSAAQVPQLKLKWAFGFPGVEQTYGQPTVAGGHVFVGVDSGYVYSLDAATGCVYWSFQAQSGVRNAISVGSIKGSGPAGYAAYFGDLRANVYAVNAGTVELLWRVKADEHPLAVITGAPTLYDDRLY